MKSAMDHTKLLQMSC